MKRFYQTATAGPGAEGTGFTVLLDGRPVRTPARRSLSLPSEALAKAVAAEWQAQGQELALPEMRLTRLATTVVDLMPARRADAIAEVTGYAATDLLCYRVAEPGDLARRQADLWQPWLDWLERDTGARLVVTRTVDPVPQPEASLETLAAAVEAFDDWRLVGLHAAVTLTGSIVLGLAMARGALTAEPAFRAALLDEIYEIERWGEEHEQQKRHARLRADLEAAERYLELLRG